jgi:hypothetical protein
MLSFQKYLPKTTLFLFLIISFVSACKQPESKLKKYGTLLEEVMLSDSGAFRGLSLGEKLDSVQAHEKGKPSEADGGYLYYENKLDSSNTFNIAYTFDESGLSEIQSDIYIANPENTDRIFNSFKRFFDDHYGASITHEDYTIWTVTSEKYGTVRINLSNQSSDFTIPNSPGKISIWIYPDAN